MSALRSRGAGALALSIAAASLGGCATRPAARPPAAPGVVASLPPADSLNSVLWTQRAVEHDLVFREIYGAAEKKLLEALADAEWDALPAEERTGSPIGLPPAVIVDVDETVLDNSPFEVRLIRTGEEYGPANWTRWCREQAAPPLPGALEFARTAAAHGVTVYYVTNRGRDLGPDTLANLRRLGFPAATDDVLLGLGTEVPGCERGGSAKGCRRRLVGQGHRVLLQLGDQVEDFVDVAANTPEGRGLEIQRYLSWIGDRWWVLPNSTYGSWQAAQFQNDWHQSRSERRRRQIEALHDGQGRAPAPSPAP